MKDVIEIEIERRNCKLKDIIIIITMHHNSLAMTNSKIHYQKLGKWIMIYIIIFVNFIKEIKYNATEVSILKDWDASYLSRYTSGEFLHVCRKLPPKCPIKTMTTDWGLG